MTFRTAALAATALAAFAIHSASAAIISAQAVPPGSIPFTLDNLGTSSTTGLVGTSTIQSGGETISFSGGSPTSGVYHGDTPFVASSPFDGTGLAQANYLAAEPGGSITISFTSPQTEFDLLWGSVDSFNNLTFNFGGVTISGQDIANAGTGINLGTTNAAVEITNLAQFTTVTVTSGSAAFEFVPGVQVPEPASVALLGLGLLGLGVARRGRRSGARGLTA